MKDRLKKITNYFTIKNVSYISIILNLASIVLGIIYLAIPIYNIIWDIFGIIIFITLFSNLLLIYLNSIKLNKTSELGNKMNIICYIFLFFTILAMLGIILGNLLISVTYSSDLIDNLAGYSMVYINYFGLLAFGIIIAYIDIKNLDNDQLWDLSQNFKRPESRRFFRAKRILKKLLKIFCYLTLFIGIILVFGLIAGIMGFPLISALFEPLICFKGQFGGFLSIIWLSITIILLKLKKREKNPKRYKIFAIIGIIISGMLLLPLFLTSYTIYDAERNFSEAFGNDWRNLPSDVEQYFLQTPFSTPEYFLGIPPKDCIVEKHIPFYNDEGISLYFDAYMPKSRGTGLPGENSTLIRIHGGAWVLGDKGIGSLSIQLNKYFAAQGYIVFDIQYGLHKLDILDFDPYTPKYRKGDFNIDDMVRHIGIFCKYLTNHSKEYGANLDSVFVSGGSAGGHLTMATALGIASGKYTSFFGTNLTIKGLVPIYPGSNGLMTKFPFYIDGTKELTNPELLIDSSSPPCLIYQGTHDLLQMFNIAQNIKNTYKEKGNKACTVLWMPIAAHASDMYFNGYYCQIFLYFMERFLYLYH